MKEIELSVQTKVSLQIEVQKEVEQEKQLERIGKIVPRRGHTVFKINKETLEVTLPTYLTQDFRIDLTSKELSVQKRDMLVEEGFFYTSACNKKNALKNFLKGSDGSLFDEKKQYLKLKTF